jgi:hypothetical protein
MLLKIAQSLERKTENARQARVLGDFLLRDLLRSYKKIRDLEPT